VSESELVVATLNLQDGGVDKRTGETSRLELLPELLQQVPGEIDLLLFQEGLGFDLHGQQLRYRAENLLRDFGLRSFMTRSLRGQLHELVFARWPRLRPVQHHQGDLPGVFHDQIGWLRFHLEGLQPVLAVKSVQWASWSGDVRMEEAQKLTRYAAPDVAAIIAGDFNSLWPDCSRRSRLRPSRRVHREFEPRWMALLPHKRLHKSLQPGARSRPWWSQERLVSDRRALTVLAEAGFVSAGCAAGDMTVTVNAHIDNGQGARIDHIVVSPLLAPAIVADSYRVFANELGDRASDHRMASISLDLDRLAT
jgi:endonuclease/exonuclease/phosphatase family metal-dependent hydrolase